jgi:hypothetical protein
LIFFNYIVWTFRDPLRIPHRSPFHRKAFECYSIYSCWNDRRYIVGMKRTFFFLALTLLWFYFKKGKETSFVDRQKRKHFDDVRRIFLLPFVLGLRIFRPSRVKKKGSKL